MAYDDKTFPEFADARGEDGVCTICGASPGQEHGIKDHDNWDAADEATWD